MFDDQTLVLFINARGVRNNRQWIDNTSIGGCTMHKACSMQH